MPFDENDEIIQIGGGDPTGGIGIGTSVGIAAILGSIFAYRKYRNSNIRKSILCEIEKNITVQMLDNLRETHGELFLFSIHGVSASFIIKEMIRTNGKLDFDDDEEMKILTEQIIKCIIRSLRKESLGGNGNKKCFLDKYFNELEKIEKKKIAENPTEVLNAIKNLVNCKEVNKRKEQIEIFLKAFKIIEMIKKTINYAAKKMQDIVDNGALYLLDKLIEKQYNNPKGKKAIDEKDKAKNDTGYEGYHDMCHVLFTHIPSTNYQLFGIPFLLHKGMNKSIKLLNEGYPNISKIVQDIKLIPCFRLLDAFIKDIMTPLNKEIQKNAEKLISNIPDLNRIIKIIELQMKDCKKPDNAGKKKESVFLCKETCCCLGVDDYSITENKKILSGGAVIGEGTFGCVFRPHIKCKNSKNKKVEYVTKLMFESNKEIIEREMKLTEKIKKIPNYQDYFAPIEELCNANMSKFNEKDKKDCGLIKKKNKYIKKIANIRFIEGDDLSDTLKGENEKDSFIYFLTMYEQILDGLQLLINKKIVHFDIKSNNMIYNKKKNKTFIFDFGLSFDIENIINLQDIFYIEWAPEWTLWPIEVHYLGFIISKKRKMIKSEIKLFATEYTNKHSVFRKLNNLISDVFIKSYKDKIIKTLNIYNNKKDLNEIIYYIINSSWNTWDNYALNIMFFRFLNVVNIIGFSNNKFYQELVKLFYNNISPIPYERNSIKETKKRFQNIKKLLTPRIFNQISKNLNDYKIIIEKTLKNDNEKTISMGNKIRNLR